jgi:hypothetical protein
VKTSSLFLVMLLLTSPLLDRIVGRMRALRAADAFDVVT